LKQNGNRCVTPADTTFGSTAGLVRRALSNPSDYMPDFIIDIFEPIIIFFIVILHPRVPSLAIPVLIIAKCLFISHFFRPSGIPAIIIVIFDMSAPEHDIISADAGPKARTAVARTVKKTIAHFIVNLMRENR
jgi:hypothetical protein